MTRSRDGWTAGRTGLAARNQVRWPPRHCPKGERVRLRARTTSVHSGALTRIRDVIPALPADTASDGLVFVEVSKRASARAIESGRSLWNRKSFLKVPAQYRKGRYEAHDCTKLAIFLTRTRSLPTARLPRSVAKGCSTPALLRPICGTKSVCRNWANG
jgi:hypothetical protein